jgi:hypothetical protein
MMFHAVPGSANCADIFTEPLGRDLFEMYRKDLGVHPSHP